jgi:hypothetical protein
MTHDAIIEAAARALKDWSDPAEARRVAAAILTAVAPLIRAEVLEEAAKIVEDYDDFSVTEIAAVIRALKEQP